MSFPRRFEPEWLDELPADDPRALRARQGLKRINAVMSNASRMAGALLKHAGSEPPRTIIDLGSGDGQFALKVARKLAPRWPNVTVTLLDQQNIVSAETRAAFAALGWRVEPTSADVLDFLAKAPRVDAITANLFLHHFTDEPLARLFGHASERAQLFVACEPRRAKLVVRASRLLWVIGCNDVLVHDAVVSARAGFNGQEMSALWPKAGPWELHEQMSGLFTHCFVARRTAGA